MYSHQQQDSCLLSSPTGAADNSAVCAVFHSHFDKLVRGITQPTALIPVIYARQLISEADKNRITTLTGTDDIDRATRLMNTVEVTMKAAPRAERVLRELCGAVDEYPALKCIADSMRTALG